MARSSEEVLLITGHVRHKKSDGSLYMMAERLAWMPESKEVFTISHNYADIKVQKISPDTKEKVQLQVVLHDGGANTFHFTNPQGREAQMQSRLEVKELLQQLLPKFRNKVNSELEEKNRMLQEDPELFQLYKDLVVSGVVSSEEFWANRTKKATATKATKQDVGVSAAFLADIKPQTDGCNGLKYNLTADVIESVFRTYPTVKQKHAEYVPDKLSESEFWTRFFQSHYFHRDRISFSTKDLFADCVKTDEQDIKSAIEKSSVDPLVDLTQMSDSSLGEGYGVSGEEKPGQSNATNASLIKRFNQHSMMVLKADTPAVGASDKATGCTNGLNSKPGQTSEPPEKKTKLKEKLEYDDLETQAQSKGPALNLTRRDRYLHGPTPAVATQYTTSDDVLHACHALSQEMVAWNPALPSVISGNTAVTVLGELSPGGALMLATSQQQLNQLVPLDVQQEVKQLYNALAELLRHFWACFPTTDKYLEEKVIRMRSSLERFQAAKLNPVKDKLQHYHYTVDLTGHMEELLYTANTKFMNWQARRSNRKS